MRKPDWYGERYPTETDLVSSAEAFGAWVSLRHIRAASYIPATMGGPPMIIVPNQRGPLAVAWALAHELGHLYQHSGPPPLSDGGAWPALNQIRSKNERQANMWAAMALIPEARVRHYANASVDAFIGALSANYEDLPPDNCPQRELAHRIATHRLDAMKAKIGKDGLESSPLEH